MGSQYSRWTIPQASLVIVLSAVLVLSYVYGQTDTQTRRQTRMNALLTRLSLTDEASVADQKVAWGAIRWSLCDLLY